jgi:ferritin-like metal-binding protein YciE
MKEEGAVLGVPPGSVQSAALVAAWRKVEHYETTADGSLWVFTENLGLEDEIEVPIEVLYDIPDAHFQLIGIAEAQG